MRHQKDNTFGLAARIAIRHVETVKCGVSGRKRRLVERGHREKRMAHRTSWSGALGGNVTENKRGKMLQCVSCPRNSAVPVILSP
jgi:hypothetical protein